MLAFEFLLEFVYSSLIAMVATAFAVATVFRFFRISKKPGFSFKMMNISLLGLLTTAVSSNANSKITDAFLFAFAYLYILREISEHLSKFDDIFRAFFLSMGYTRHEYFMNVIFKFGKWKLLQSVLSFSLVTTSIIFVLGEFRRLIPGQIDSLALMLSVLFAVICVLTWFVERDRNKLSNSE
ncbi:hypothetical protein AT15_01055 [Kosmotoga arenicorallina S304]|uniref:Uncharacterized protein n=1 Tax=Kosmotoga arenicorallina S304 TaxID=1453497 RepID=A0A176K0Z2_9BACT|nr:hypothetical protein [Kosmotoga arenicorallina]OAA30135.1 hypothetical protein AT15_01055 [Kosmotoga arenicorallina S304]